MFRHEVVVTGERLPFKVVIHRESVPMITKHWHESIEINYTIHGDGDYFVSGVTTHIKDDDFIIINSGDVHGVSDIGPGNKRRSLTLLIPMETMIKIKPDFRDYLLVSNNGNPKQINKVRRELRQIYMARTSSNQDNDIMIVDILGHFYLLMGELLKHFLVKKKNLLSFNDEQKQTKVKQIISFLVQNYQTPLTLDTIAKEFDFSRNYLDRLFKKEMNISLIHYLQLIRLDFAFKQITNTDHSLTQIADECGFANPKSLQKLFKEVYGKNPKDYRKSILGQ